MKAPMGRSLNSSGVISPPSDRIQRLHCRWMPSFERKGIFCDKVLLSPATTCLVRWPASIDDHLAGVEAQPAVLPVGIRAHLASISALPARQGDGWKIRRDTADEGTGY